MNKQRRWICPCCRQRAVEMVQVGNTASSMWFACQNCEYRGDGTTLLKEGLGGYRVIDEDDLAIKPGQWYWDNERGTPFFTLYAGTADGSRWFGYRPVVSAGQEPRLVLDMGIVAALDGPIDKETEWA